MSILLNGFFLRKDATHPLGLLNKTGYAQFGVAGAIIILITILASSIGTHDQIRYLHRPPKRDTPIGETLRQVFATLSNPSLLVLLASGVLGGAAAGMQTGLDYYFYTHLWGLQPSQLAILLPIITLGSVIAVVAAPPLAKRFGKKGAMIGLFTVSTLVTLTPMSLKLLNLMPPTGSPWIFIILTVTATTALTFAITGLIIITSMVADVAEDTAVKTGVRSEGLLFAANGLVPKFTAGLGAFFAGILVTVVHFPTHAVQGTVPMATMRHLVLLYLPTYASLVIASVVVLVFYRIDRRTHEHNLQRLQEMEALGMTAGDVEGGPPASDPAAMASGHAY
jgi:Na+/melibiose symporter-like transporter